MSETAPKSGITRVGFVSTRIAGTDGVSLEIHKWTEVLSRMGYDCYFICGHSDRDPKRTFFIPEANFGHPLIQEINRKCFGRYRRVRQMSELIHSCARDIKNRLYDAMERFKLDLLIAENALTIPMNIPLGEALTEMLLETLLPCIAHHHDFAWERERFNVNAVGDYIAANFPPRLQQIQHVVINTVAGREFSRRTGLPYRIIPNVMDFAHPPTTDDYAADFRRTIGLADDDLLILQPTRIVPRKGIEHSIELVRRLENPKAKLVISHHSGDEGPEYLQRLRDYAAMLGVDVIFAGNSIGHHRGTAEDGKKRYTIWDVYPHADLVAYPSSYEGFGNAFLEAVYYRKPIFCNRYAIYRSDIEPYGFRAAEMDGFITQQTVADVRRILGDADYRREIVEHNERIGREFFSYDRVEGELRGLLTSITTQPKTESL
ncbi:MAG: glycosyltransferase [Planctomycetaceae bacterium]